MKKKNKLPWIIPVFILFTVLVLNFSVVGSTLKVCKVGCEFSSIGEALDNSSDGDRIKVQNGNYTEDLKIDRDVSIVGTNPRWVSISPSTPDSPAVLVGPSDTSVELTSVTVTGEGRRPQNGVIVTGDSRLKLTNSRVSNFENGLTVKDSSSLRVRSSEVFDSGVGVTGVDKAEVVVSDTKITSVNTGVLAGKSSGVTLVDITVSNCDRYGLLAEETAKINILSSSITNNQAPGVVLKDFSRLSMEDTQVSSNAGGGILVKNSAKATLKANRITYNSKKNVTVISKKCGFSGPSDLFFGEINGSGNEIKPGSSGTICPSKFSRITSSEGGSYSYQFKPSTYVFIGLIGAASLYFLISK